MATISTTQQSWKHFPRYLALAMALVVAVNARFIYIAVQTFPGAASNDDFDTSNKYDAVLRAAAVQDALGWSVQATAKGTAAIIDLAGPDHHALAGAAVAAHALRPLGPDMQTMLTFREAVSGHYVADTALGEPGQWDLQLELKRNGQVARMTRRIIVK